MNELTNTERQARIIQLAESAINGAERTRRQARKSIDQAIECGRLLNQEKAAARAAGIGWGVWFERYSKAIPERTARLWQALARRADQQIPQQNLQRHGMLALELMPAKLHPVVVGNVVVSCPNNHISLIMRVERWITDFPKLNSQPITPSYAARLLRDFKRITEFVDWLKTVR